MLFSLFIFCFHSPFFLVSFELLDLGMGYLMGPRDYHGGLNANFFCLFLLFFFFPHPSPSYYLHSFSFIPHSYTSRWWNNYSKQYYFANSPERLKFNWILDKSKANESPVCMVSYYVEPEEDDLLFLRYMLILIDWRGIYLSLPLSHDLVSRLRTNCISKPEDLNF